MVFVWQASPRLFYCPVCQLSLPCKRVQGVHISNATKIILSIFTGLPKLNKSFKVIIDYFLSKLKGGYL
jgi:hypothetical protein